MKPTSIIVSALATLVAAAPSKPVEERGLNNFNNFNNFQGFRGQDFNYLLAINQLNLNQLGQLNQFNNFDILGFQSLFQSNQFNIADLLRLQAIQTTLAFANAGVLSAFDFSGFNNDILQLGLLDNSFNQFNLGSIIDQSFIPQIQSIASSIVILKE